MTLRLILLAAAALVPLAAQDTFEIQVYEYETVPKGLWNLETHLNTVGRGTRQYENSVAPTHHQVHLAYELTRGLTDYFELAGYLLLARRPGRAPDFAGWRLRPRVRLPESWLPVRVSLSAEVGFPRPAYEESSMTLELRPIIEKTFGRVQVDLNPVLARSLRGPSDGWEFEPAARVASALSRKFDLSLEYYGSTGPVTGFLPVREQAHIFYPGGDWQLTDKLVWNFGIGVAATPAGNKLTYKMRLGFLFGRKGS